MKRIFYLLLIVICAACENDDSFSTSTGLQLSFSVDTLKMDTVFSNVPSSTYAFWVHNRNDAGIRISTVRLKRGNQTGFRVNVDGVYLDNSNGSQSQNVEIRRKDSVLVFVELTAAATQQLDPKLVEDDLLFDLESGREQKVNLRAWAWDATKLYSTVIETNTEIESEQPLVIYGDLTVKEGATLTLRNTELYFHDDSGLEVYGTLHTENCLMRGDRLDNMFDYLPYNRVSGQWAGIHFYESSTANKMEGTEIRNASEGIVCDSAAIDDDIYRLKMDECIIHNSLNANISSVNTHLILNHCQLSNAGGDCLAVFGGNVTLSYCTLAQFYPFTAQRGDALYFTNRWGLRSLPLTITCEGSIVTGYADDVLKGEDIADGTDFFYHFNDCLLRTAEVKDSENFIDIIWESPKDETGGKKHFVKIDEDNFIYDFHLVEDSPAQGLGCY
ncbi:MAG: right-handed parallel beta-helix repeat-containing protein [Prevotella sp.]|nr:right-handed parallel beta-helix repeat-containing protein [Prevotella sp.]